MDTLLYYDRAIDSTLLAALSKIAAQQTNGTSAITEVCHQLLEYVAMHPNVGIRYHACIIILAAHTNASYLSEQGGESQSASHFYLTNIRMTRISNNGTIHTLSSIIKHIMSSAWWEAKLATLYYGYKLAASKQTTLKELGHIQPSTSVTTDNVTAQGLTMGMITPKASKSMDQRFHWHICYNTQCQFHNLWCKGILNCAEYSSKHHPPNHHWNVRKF